LTGADNRSILQVVTQDTPDVVSKGRKFRFLRLLATGGFGEVYVAEMSNAEGFAKTVTVKLMKPGANDPELAQRMRDEARLLGMLHHPNIVQAEDLLTVGGRPAVVMEYVPGADLAALLPLTTNPEPIPPRVGPQLVRKVALALDAAMNRPSTLTGHALGVLHRDIKPANLRITPDGEIKVLDFGIAKAKNITREAQTTDYQLGTLPYMSPEVLAGDEASHVSDIYALGVTLYEILARKRFGWAGESADTHEYQVTGRLADLDLTAWKDVAPRVVSLLRSMVAFDPADRPSGMEVAKICRQLLDSLDGEHLEDWARRCVELTTDFSPSGDDGSLVGQVLAAETGLSSMDLDIDSDSETMAIPSGSNTASIHAAPTISLPLNENRPPPQVGETKVSKVHYAGGVAAVLVLATLGGFFLTQEPASVPQTPAQTAPVAPATAADELPTEPEFSTVPLMEVAAPAPAPTVTPSPPRALRPESQEPPPVEVAQVKEEAPAEKAAPPPALPAMVRIASIPFGVPVQVDGKSVGKTPLKDLELMSGPHTLTFLDKDQSVEREVQVLPGNKNLWTYRRSDGSIE
jgi:serine/threonine-protein kinase